MLKHFIHGKNTANSVDMTHGGTSAKSTKNRFAQLLRQLAKMMFQVFSSGRASVQCCWSGRGLAPISAHCNSQAR